MEWLLASGVVSRSKAKTAFSLGQGLWQFKVALWYLECPSSFQHLMERVLVDILWSCYTVYLGGLAHAADFEEVLTNLRDVSLAICPMGLRLHPKKCNFF